MICWIRMCANVTMINFKFNLIYIYKYMYICAHHTYLDIYQIYLFIRIRSNRAQFSSREEPNILFYYYHHHTTQMYIWALQILCQLNVAYVCRCRYEEYFFRNSLIICNANACWCLCVCLCFEDDILIERICTAQSIPDCLIESVYEREREKRNWESDVEWMRERIWTVLKYWKQFEFALSTLDERHATFIQINHYVLYSTMIMQPDYIIFFFWLLKWHNWVILRAFIPAQLTNVQHS